MPNMVSGDLGEGQTCWFSFSIVSVSVKPAWLNGQVALLSRNADVDDSPLYVLLGYG